MATQLTKNIVRETDLDRVGKTTVVVGPEGVTLKRRRRALTLTWDQVLDAATAPETTSVPKKVHANLDDKIAWFVAGVKEGE